MADFINIIQTIIGTDTNALDNPGDITQAGLDAAPAIGGIWQGIKNKQLLFNQINTDIGVLNTNVNDKSANVDLKSANVDSKSSTVDSQYNTIAVTSINGNTGMYGDIVSKHGIVVTSENNIGTIESNITNIKDDLYGTDNVNGSAGSALATINSLNANVNAKSANVDTKSINVDNKSSVVDTQFTAIAGIDGTGNTTGMYKSIVDSETTTVTAKDTVVAKEVILSPHYTSIDIIGSDLLTGSNSNVNATGLNLQKGVNSEIIKVGIDLLSGSSSVELVGLNIANIAAVNNNSTNINTVAQDNVNIDNVSTNIASVNSVSSISAAITSVNNNATNINTVADNDAAITAIHDDIIPINNVNTKLSTDIAYVANDLIGKDISGIVYSTNGGISRIESVADNLLLGSNSDILNAESNAIKSADWAEKSTEVEIGKFSAKYWAEQASSTVGGGIIDDGAKNSIKVYSSEKSDMLNNVLRSSIMQLSDSYSELSVPSLGNLVAGVDTPIQFSVIKQPDNSSAFSVDEALNTIDLTRATSYSCILSLDLTSATNSGVATTVKLVDSSGSILAIQSIPMSIASGDSKIYEFVLPFDIQSIQNGCSIKINASSSGLNITSGSVYIISSISPDINVDVSNIEVNVQNNTSAINNVTPNYVAKNLNYVSSKNDYIFADSSASSFAVTLPELPLIGDSITILDSTNSFSTNNVTVLRNGNNIMGVASDLALNISNTESKLIFSGVDWRLV